MLKIAAHCGVSEASLRGIRLLIVTSQVRKLRMARVLCDRTIGPLPLVGSLVDHRTTGYGQLAHRMEKSKILTQAPPGEARDSFEPND